MHSHAPSPTELGGKKNKAYLSSLHLSCLQRDLGNPYPESHVVGVVTPSFPMRASSRAALSTFLVVSAKYKAQD